MICWLLCATLAHVNDILAVECHTPLLEESGFAPIARVGALAFRMNTLRLLRKQEVI
jgi:hypothetical protein